MDSKCGLMICFIAIIVLYHSRKEGAGPELRGQGNKQGLFGSFGAKNHYHTASTASEG